jgi:hypothetical protein
VARGSPVGMTSRRWRCRLQPGAVCACVRGRWPSAPWADSNGAGLGAVQVGQTVAESWPVRPFSFKNFFSNKFQSSDFKNTNHNLT